MEHKRNMGIDLLRIILMFMVCLQHVITKSGIEDTGIGPNAYLYWFIDIFCCCAVNAYAMISGYVSNKRTIQYRRIINLWFQAIFYSFVVSMTMNLFYFKKDLSLSFVIKSLMPITNNTFWYVTAYIPLLFLMPFLNRWLDEMEEEEIRRLFVAVLFVFSILALLGDSWSSYGYSCIWIIILYITGRIMKRIGLFRGFGNATLLLLYLLSTVLTWTSFYITGIPRMAEYISPSIVLCAMILVAVFSRIDVQSKAVQKIGSLTLGIYLLQGNPLFSQFFFQNIIPLDGSVLLSSLLLIFFKSALLMIIGCVVEEARVLLFGLLRVDRLELIFARLLEWIIGRLQKLLDYFC